LQQNLLKQILLVWRIGSKRPHHPPEQPSVGRKPLAKELFLFGKFHGRGCNLNT
jgi:hypothetical protein